MKREPSFLLDDSGGTAPSPSGNKKKMVGRRKGSLLFMLFVGASMMLIAPAMADTVVVESEAARGGAVVWEEMEALKVDKADSAIPSTTAEKDTNLRGSFKEPCRVLQSLESGVEEEEEEVPVEEYYGEEEPFAEDVIDTEEVDNEEFKDYEEMSPPADKEDSEPLETFDEEEEEEDEEDFETSHLLLDNVHFCEPADEFDRHCDGFSIPELSEDYNITDDPDLRRFLKPSDEENDFEHLHEGAMDENSNRMNYISNETSSSDQDHRSLWWKRSRIRRHQDMLSQWVGQGKMEGVTFKQIYNHRPVFDYCDTCCFPSIEVDTNGVKNPGYGSCDFAAGGSLGGIVYPNKCRPRHYMTYSNTYHKMGRFCEKNGSRCFVVHMYILYFEMDYSLGCVEGHNHDQEKVMIAYEDGKETPYKIGVSGHGKINHIRNWKRNDIPKHYGRHPKIVYKRGVFNTREFQWAGRSNQPVDSDNPMKTWTTPEIVTLDLMTSKQKSRNPEIAQETHTGWVKNYLHHFGFAGNSGRKSDWLEVPLTVPQGWDRILRNANLCATMRNYNGPKKWVQFSNCPSGRDYSFEWAFVKHTTYGRKGQWGFLYNRNFKYCLEAGKSKIPGIAAFGHKCNGEDWQLWREVGSGSTKRYQNKYSNLYLTNSKCKNASDPWLRVAKTITSGDCACSQHVSNSSPDCGLNSEGIKNVRKNMSVDLYKGRTANGSTVGLFRSSANSPNQRWKFYSDGSIRPSIDTSKCLEAGVNPSLYTKVFIWKCNGKSHQAWTRYTSGRIKNKYHNYYLGVEYCGERSSKRLELRHYENGACGEAQKWRW